MLDVRTDGNRYVHLAGVYHRHAEGASGHADLGTVWTQHGWQVKYFESLGAFTIDAELSGEASAALIAYTPDPCLARVEPKMWLENALVGTNGLHAAAVAAASNPVQSGP